jgi:hypothetical protein
VRLESIKNRDVRFAKSKDSATRELDGIFSSLTLAMHINVGPAAGSDHGLPRAQVAQMSYQSGMRKTHC